jgi:hypothetical protein
MVRACPEDVEAFPLGTWKTSRRPNLGFRTTPNPVRSGRGCQETKSFPYLHLHALAETVTLRSDMTNADRSESAAKRSHNRIAAIMMHADCFSFRGTSRLAVDPGISKSTMSHLVRGTSGPLSITPKQVIKVLVARLGWLPDEQEVVFPTGSYPTSSDCAPVVGRRCLPDHYREERIKEQLRRLPLLATRRPASLLLASIEKDYDAPVYAEEE